jgi:hypothetical protein
MNDLGGWSELAVGILMGVGGLNSDGGWVVGIGSRNFDFRPIVSVMSISEARPTENPDFFFPTPAGPEIG